MCVDRYPDDAEFQDRLAKSYAEDGNTDEAIAGWTKLTIAHPDHIQLVERLATAYSACSNYADATFGLRALLQKHPSNVNIQECLSNVYAIEGNKLDAISGWLELALSHPTEKGILGRLHAAYVAQNDHNLAMKGWWNLLLRNPFRISILQRFRDACYSRRGVDPSVQSIVSLLHFSWLCVLRFLSDKSVEYNFGELDWWPFATVDELMMLRPYMVQIEWKFVTFLMNRSPLIQGSDR